MSANINTRILKLVDSAWEEVKERVCASRTVLSDLINRISFVAIKQGALSCYTASKKSMIWLAQKISAGSACLCSPVTLRVASIWEGITRSEFKVSHVDDPERLSFFPQYNRNYFSLNRDSSFADP